MDPLPVITLKTLEHLLQQCQKMSQEQKGVGELNRWIPNRGTHLPLDLTVHKVCRVSGQSERVGHGIDILDDRLCSMCFFHVSADGCVFSLEVKLLTCTLLSAANRLGTI